MAILSCLKRAKTSKTEVVTFSRLDYWSMLDLFDRLPLHDLVRLNGLASWWSGYVHKVCRTKRDITVQFGHKSKYDITDDDTQDHFNIIKVTSIDSLTSDRLALLLPSITSLEIIINGWKRSYDIDDITYLILKWSHQLVNLKIKCNSYHSLLHLNSENRKMQFKQLHLSLNKITSLRRLSINCKWWNCLAMQDSIDLPILSHLEYFYFHIGYYDFENLRHSLIRYAGLNRLLKQIVLPSFIWSLPGNLQQEHQLLSKFTTLNISHRLTRDQWELFPNLTTVDLGFIHSRSKFMRNITDMQGLKHIRNLDMGLLITRAFDDNLDQVPIDLPQLSSVTNLKLRIFACSPTNPYPSFKFLQLGTIFPNVESVHLSYHFDHSSYRVVKWMAKTWNKISYRKFKLRVRRELAGVECTFGKPY